MGLTSKGALSLLLVLIIFTLHSVDCGRPPYWENRVDESRSPDELLAKLLDLTAAVRSLLSNVPPLNNRDELTWEDFTTRVFSSLSQIITEVARVADVLTDQAFHGIVRQLSDAKSELFALAHSIDRQMELAVEHLNESLINRSEYIDLWTAKIKEDMRHFNDTRVYNKACQLVDGLINNASLELRSCCNITIKPIVSLCRSFRALLANALRIMADVLHRMQLCLEDKNSYLEYMTPCIHLAYDEIIGLIEGAARMRRKISRLLPVRLLYSKCCVSLALVEIEESQQSLTNELYEF